MLLSLALVIAGLGLLTVAADQFVIGAARVATILRLSPVLVGAVVVGFGTSAPEMLVSALSAAQGELDIAVGNIIGSNVANLSLVLGVAAIISPLAISSSTLRREAPLSAAAVVVVALVIQGGVGRLQGLLLLTGMIGSLVLLVSSSRRETGHELESEVEELLGEATPDRTTEVLRTVLGLVGTVGGAQLLLTGALGVADRLELAEGFVGLTLVAVGTSLPELVTSIQAARRGEDELIAGNLLGSNLFNSLAVGGVAGLAGPGTLDDPHIAGVGAAVMVALALGAWLMMGTGGRVVQRWNGALLLGVYAVTVPLLAS